VKLTFNPKEIIPAFDRFLGNRGIVFSAIAVGGAALAILDIVIRGTRDLDLLEPEIPPAVAKAAKEFAQLHGLSEDWLNCGPGSLARELPPDWKSTVVPLFNGKNLRLSTLSRINLIRAKLWAMCDRMRDLEDLVALAPTDDEINLAAVWVKPLDGNPGWPAHVDLTIQILRRSLGRG